MKYNELIASYAKYYQAKNYKKALKYVRRAILNDPKQYEAWAMLANLYLLELNSPAESVHSLKIALGKYHPDNVVLMYCYAQALFEVKNYKDSLQFLQKVLHQDPENNSAWELLDKIYATDKNLQQIIDTIRKDTFSQFVGDAKRAFQLNHLKDAITNYERAIQIIPSNEEIMDELARLYFRQHNYATSQVYVNQLLALRPKDPSVLNLKGFNHLNLNQLEDAYENFKKSMHYNPQQNTLKKDFEELQLKIAKIYNKEGDLLQSQKKYLDAIKAFQQTLKFHQGDPYALNQIRMIQTTQQKEEKNLKEQETKAFLNYLKQESRSTDELPLKEILLEMPPHSDVSDELSLRGFLKSLINSQKLPGILSSQTLRLNQGLFARMALNFNDSPDNVMNMDSSSSQTTILKHSNLPVIILREGVLDGNSQTYSYTLKIQNNLQYSIKNIRTFLYFPEDCLKLENENPQQLPEIKANQLGSLTFFFSMKLPILSGSLQSVVLYLDQNEKLCIQEVSEHEIENITSSMKPLQLNPQKLAQILQESQNFLTHQEKFQLNQSPQISFNQVQRDLQTLHFHVQKATQSEIQGQFKGFIHAMGRVPTIKDPILLEVHITGQSGATPSEVVVISSSSSSKVSQITSHTVMRSIIMPQCPVCDQVFPISFHSKLKKGETVICEYCGSPFTEK